MSAHTLEQIEAAKAVGHIASGLFIVSARSESGQMDGYLASWVQQFSFSPLLVAFAISPTRPGYDSIVSGKAFTINIVGEHDTMYLKHFWKGYAPENSPFNEIEHTISPKGGLIIGAAKSALDCKMVQKIKPGDHEIVIAEVVASYSLNTESKPRVHIRKSGLDY